MKYKFDIITGHYYAINEDEEPINQVNTNEKPDTSTNNATSNNKYISVETDEQIKQITANLDSEQKKYETDKANLKNKIAQAKQNAQANSSATGSFDHIETDTTVLSLKKQLLDRTKQFNDIWYRYENEKIVRLQTLSTLKEQQQNTSERIYRRYKQVINEGNINNYKVYMKGLFNNIDEMQSALKESNLLYGQDYNDLYIICVNDEDVKNIYEALHEIGYNDNVIRYTIQPQLLAIQLTS